MLSCRFSVLVDGWTTLPYPALPPQPDTLDLSTLAYMIDLTDFVGNIET